MKFNPGYTPQVVAVPTRKLTRRGLDKAIAKLAKYFNVDNDLEHVARIAEYYGYSLGTTDHFVFVVLDGSEFASIAVEHGEIWDLTVRSEEDRRAVVIL